MKNEKLIKFRNTFLFGLAVVLTLGCERDLTDEAVLATFSTVGEVFIDDPIGMGTDFYFPFLGSKPDAAAFTGEGYESSSSIRVDVPNDTDPNGNYAGAALIVDGAGRDLSGFTALTFWAKASRGVALGEIGFGVDFGEDKYRVAVSDMSLGTNWSKYVVAIPDPSQLTEERGMVWYSAGTQGTGGSGYTIWFDDIQFEDLGTIGQSRPAIAEGNDIIVDTFVGASVVVTGTVTTFNLNTGLDQIVSTAPGYYEFTSSNESVATVSESGFVEILSGGTSVITASLGGVPAEGSITINSTGEFPFAPTPTRDSSTVTSIFSDAYDNINVDFFNGFWEPFQTTLSADFAVNGDNILNYTNFNFVGNQFSNPTVDATVQSNLHVNMFIPAEIQPDLDFLITIRDFGPDQSDGGGDDSFQQVFFYADDFTANTWATLEIPITMINRNNIGLIIYENINNPTTSSIENFYLDNIYFYSN